MTWIFPGRRTQSRKATTRVATACLLLVTCSTGSAGDLERTLRGLDVRVFPEEERAELVGMVARDIERRRLQAIGRENDAWGQVDSREDWVRFRDVRLRALKKSLGPFPDVPKRSDVRVTDEIQGDGYQIENIVFQTRPGIVVTANLYAPSEPAESMPAIMLVHSHHNPKTQGELQDMGMTWARQGCLVLVMDLLGHGERSQHPFVRADQYPGPFRLGRQDYHFRYNIALQLHLVGESLMGWMVWDLMRGVDLLLSRAGVDEDRVILIGSVAGGGDPAGVTGALDRRIAAVVPFNFGGPQPDYAIPTDAQREFYYFGIAYWEMTRCLRLGARDGFAHWVIVGSVAPRRLIYAHEFSWDRDRDPVWPRLEEVFGLHDVPDHLDFATGRGQLSGRPPESSHCNNVGPLHRSKLYPHLQGWFNMPVPNEEFQQRRDDSELMCLTAKVREELEIRTVREVAGKLADQRLSEARRKRQALGLEARREQLRGDWSRMLGHVTPTVSAKVRRQEEQKDGEFAVERIALETEEGIIVPLVLVSVPSKRQSNSPLVVVLSRVGRERLVNERADELAVLLTAGATLCLPDLRGTGETSPGGSYGPRSTVTSLSCRDQVLGRTLLGSRLFDLRCVLEHLRERRDLSGALTLWGDSLAETNPPERNEVVPLGVENPNAQAEPSGGLLALLGALFEEDVRAVFVRGTFVSFRSLLDSQFLYVPHDSVVFGVLTVGDISDLAAALAPRPLRMERFVDGLNRAVSDDAVQEYFAPTSASYQNAQAGDRLTLTAKNSEPPPAVWLLNHSN